MPRPAPWRLDPATYPHHDIIQTRFQDLDVLGHINNVAWAALFETARVRFYHTLSSLGPGRNRGLVAISDESWRATGNRDRPYLNLRLHRALGWIRRL